MTTKFHQLFREEKISRVRMRSPVVVKQNTPLHEVLARMKSHKRGCAIIKEHSKIIGIFTERDLLTRVITPKLPLETPVFQVMTKNPEFLTTESSIGQAIQLMSDHGYRHIPLVDDRGFIQGFVSVRDILDYLSDHFPYEVYSLPPDPDQTNKAPDGA